MPVRGMVEAMLTSAGGGQHAPALTDTGALPAEQSRGVKGEMETGQRRAGGLYPAPAHAPGLISLGQAGLTAAAWVSGSPGPAPGGQGTAPPPGKGPFPP